MPRPMLVIVPTRGRPDNALALEEAWCYTASAGVSELLFALDDDDPELPAYLGKLYGSDARIEVRPRLRLGPTLNLHSKDAIDAGYETIAFLGDDHRPRTANWDTRLLEQLRDFGPGFAYGNDRLMGATIPTAVAISAPIIKTLGYFAPPGLVHLNMDVAWRDLGVAINRLFYLEDVIIEHLHPAAGKAPMDARYEEVNSQAQVEADGEAYRRWHDEDFPRDVTKLLAITR